MVSEQQLTSFKWAVANDLRTALVGKVPVDTGRLKNSIKVRVNADSIEVEMTDYGLYVEYGTPPHIIRPKNKKALHWQTGTPGKRQDVFAKVVRHPGTRPNPFIRTTFKQELMRIVNDNIDLLGGAGATVEV